MTRSFSNTIETVLSVAALSIWPWPHLRKPGSSFNKYDIGVSLLAAAASCLLRPTAAIVWVAVGGQLFFTSDFLAKGRLLVITVCVGAVAILGGLVVDRIFYKTWTSTAANFFRVNVTEGISEFYGKNPWHWYISQGWPVLLGPYIGLAVSAAVRRADRTTSTKYLTLLIGWTTFVYSLLSHKEFRFLLPMLPLAIILCARELVSIPRRRLWATILIAINILLAWYSTRVHQRGVMDVMNFIRSGAQQGTIHDVLFLIPCHSTPFQSNVHAGPEFQMRFLTCEPPLGITNRTGYLDEADQFYADPVKFVNTHFPATDNDQWHTIVIFEAVEPVLRPWLTDRGYREVKRFFNSHFHDDSRRTGDLLVLSSLYRD